MANKLAGKYNFGLGDNSIDSDQYVDGSIDNEHLADEAVSSEEIDPDVIQIATVLLSAAQLKTLYSANSNAGVELIAAPGENKIINVVSATLYYNYDGNAFTAPSYLHILIDGEDVTQMITTAWLEATVDSFVVLDSDSRYYQTPNSACYLQKGDSDPTGASTAAVAAVVKIAYRIHDFTAYV